MKLLRYYGTVLAVIVFFGLFGYARGQDPNSTLNFVLAMIAFAFFVVLAVVALEYLRRQD